MACGSVIGLVMVPFLIRNLGREGYGLIGLIGVIVGFSAMADLGLRQALGRELSERVAKSDIDGFRSLSSTALALYLGIAIALISIGWILSPWFVTLFKVGPALQKEAIWLLRLYGGASLLISFITPVISAGLQSFFRFDAINMVQTLTNIVAGLLLFACISLLPFSPLLIWACVMFSVLLFNLVVLWARYREWCYSGKLGLRYLDWRKLKPLFQLGGTMYVLQIASTVLDRANPLIISFFFGPHQVALYQSASKASDLLRPVVLTLSTQVHPLTTRFHVLNQHAEQRKILVLGTRYTFLFGVIVSAGILIFADWFCKLWLFNVLGNDYMMAAILMRLLAVADIFVYLGAMHWPALLGKKKMNFALVIQIPSAIFSILVSIYLVGYTRMGIPGVLIAIIIIELVRRPVIIWYVSRITGQSIRDFILTAHIPPVILLACLSVFYFFSRGIQVNSWWSLAGMMVLFALWTCLALVAIERTLIVSLWRQRNNA